MTSSEKAFIKLDESNENEDGETPKVPKKKIPAVASGSRAAMEDQGRGIVYLSHVPHGFYEKEMFKFLSQVIRIYLSREPVLKGKAQYCCPPCIN